MYVKIGYTIANVKVLLLGVNLVTTANSPAAMVDSGMAVDEGIILYNSYVYN